MEAIRTPDSEPTQLQFDGWTFFRRSGELGREGRKTLLQTQPMQILDELLARPGELVTREQLIAKLWPKGVVDFDTALNSAVFRLRTALNDHAGTPRYIETIPRRGYRFIGQLDQPVPSKVELHSAAGVSAFAPSRRGLFAGVGTIVVVLAGLGWWLQPWASVSANFGQSTRVVDPRAHELYVRGQHHFRRHTAEDLVLAHQLFQEALVIDPSYAPAWAELAGVYLHQTITGKMVPERGLSQVRDAAERAIALDPGNAAAHVRLAQYRRNLGDATQANELMQRALEIGPNDRLVLGMAASYALIEGRLDRAVELQRRVVAMEPLAVSGRYNLFMYLIYADRLEEARIEAQALAETHPGTTSAAQALGRLALIEGRYDEALQFGQRLTDPTERQQMLAMALHGLGRTVESDSALAALMSVAPRPDGIAVAEVLAFRGETEQALHWLETRTDPDGMALWQRSDSVQRELAKYSFFLRPLHGEQRWNAWLRSEVSN